MKIKYLHILLFSFISFIITNTQAQIIINEFSASNKDVLLNNFLDNDDWIELYNAGDQVVNLSGYHLSDKIDNVTKWVFPEGIEILPNNYLLIYASGMDEVFFGEIHTNFKLTQMKQEYVILSDPSGTILDAYHMLEPTQRNHARGRATDGADDWMIFAEPTPGAANNTIGISDYIARPSFSVPAGFYYPDFSVTVAIEPTDPNTTMIRYTTDGSEPDMNSPIYTDPITVSGTRIIRARAYADNMLPSFTESNTYFINETHSMPVLSVAGNYDNLFDGLDPNTGEFIEDIVSSFEYFGVDQEQKFELEGDMKGHGNDSWQFDQKGIRFHVRDQYGYANKIDHPLFPSSDRTDYDVVIIRAAGSDNYPGAVINWGVPSCHLRDAFAQTLSEKHNLNLDTRRYRRCILYLNGRYWGLYSMRERVDSDYTKEYYDQGEKWVDMLEYWGGLETRYGNADDWFDLVQYINDNDMTDPANYAYVASEIDISSFIDYFILNTYLVNTDWLNWNTKWWRGRKEGQIMPWRYTLWDMDNIYNLGQNYTGLPITTFESNPCDVEDLLNNNDPFLDPNLEDQVGVFTGLFQNQEFLQAYINRYADLASSTFNCDTMLNHFDQMIAEIEPEMGRQIARWGGTLDEWESNLDAMRAEIAGKCTVVTTQIVDCYEDEGIVGPFNLTINVEPALSGKVQVNTVVGQSYPWAATYFGGVEINLTAIAEDGALFDRWEVNNTSFTPDQFTADIAMSLESDDVVTAYFEPAEPCQTANLTNTDSTFSSIRLDWRSISNAISYELRYKESTASSWTSMVQLDTFANFENLNDCTRYNFELRTICDAGLSAYNEFDHSTRCATSTSQLENSSISEVIAYPNPFANELTIQFNLLQKEKIRIELSDVRGQLIKQFRLDNTNQGTNSFSFNTGDQLAQGIYLIRIISADGLIVKRVIKAK